MFKRHTIAAQSLASILLLASGLSLGGCMTTDALEQDQIHNVTNASDKYPITLVKGPQTMEIDTSSSALSPAQDNAIRGFVHQAMTAGVTPLTISRPAAGGHSEKFAYAVTKLIAGQGVPRNRVILSTYGGPSNGPVRLSYISTYAQTKPCGNWSDDLTSTSDNTQYENLGCAVQANIAAEIQNPETIAVPKTADLKNSGTSVTAIARQSAVVNTVTIPTNYGFTP